MLTQIKKINNQVRFAASKGIVQLIVRPSPAVPLSENVNRFTQNALQNKLNDLHGIDPVFFVFISIKLQDI